MIRFVIKVILLILLIVIVSIFTLCIYGVFDKPELDFSKVSKNINFYTTLLAFNGPLFSLLISKLNQFKNIKNEESIRSRNKIFGILTDLQETIKFLELKYRGDKNTDFGESLDKLNMSLSKLTKEVAYFYGNNTAIADGIIGTAIFSKLNVLSNKLELSDIKESGAEIDNISCRVKQSIQAKLLSDL